MTEALAYSSWAAMRSRCTSPGNPNYPNYGGRGITICDRWNSFEAFLADMGERPSLSHSIDRIDNDGNYEPGNCRWASPKEQRANQRNLNRGHRITFNGQTLTIRAWAKTLGIKEITLGYRLRTWGSIEKCLTEPLCQGRSKAGKMSQAARR